MRIQVICLLLLLATSTGCTVAEGGRRFSLPMMGGEPKTTASQSNAESYPVSLARGRGMESNSQWDKARTHYRAMITANPERYEAYHRLGIVADNQQLYREAQNLYGEALRRSPANPQIFSDLGYSFYLEGDLSKAESAMLKAVQLDPMNSRYLNNLGLVQGHLGRLDEALTVFRQAGSEADAQYNLAFVYASHDRPDLAIVCFEKALEADPQYAAAQAAIESFRQSATEQQPIPEAAQKNLQGYVRYVEGGEDAGSTNTTVLAPRSSRLVRSARTEGFGESSLTPSMEGGHLTTSRR